MRNLLLIIGMALFLTSCTNDEDCGCRATTTIHSVTEQGLKHYQPVSSVPVDCQGEEEGVLEEYADGSVLKYKIVCD